MTKTDEIFIAYRSGHIDEARSHAARGTAVVCLDFFLERELKKENIPFISLRDVMDSETGEEEWWLLAQNIAREWYRLPAMQFFEHDGIRIGEVLEPIVERYLCELFYYARFYTALQRAYPDARLTIPVPVENEPAVDAGLISYERRAVVDAARMLGLTDVGRMHRVASRHRTSLRTFGKSLLIRTYNVLAGLLPRRKFKIYANEYWSHIAPIMSHMHDTELILTESAELKHLSWRDLLTYRIRFKHPADYLRGRMKRKAIVRADEYMREWKTAEKDVARYLSDIRAELDWSPVLEACEYLITYSPKVLADIEALRSIMTEEKPDVVLQLASVGGRHSHFFIMARIAAQLGIPSIELQHAGAYNDPRSVYSRIETDYLASYGPYTNSWYERLGYAHERLIPIGSPRFDRCLRERAGALLKGKQLFEQFGIDAKRPVLFAAVPFSDANLFMFDSYQLAEFFTTIRAAQKKVPGLQVLLKFRSYQYVGALRDYLRELFPVDMTIAGNEDIFALLCASDAAVCSNSTVIYEVALAQKPLVLHPWKKLDTYHEQMFVQAAPVTHSKDQFTAIVARIFGDSDYRESLVAQGQRFLNGEVFDGHSAERMAAFVRSPLTARPNEKV